MGYFLGRRYIPYCHEGAAKIEACNWMAKFITCHHHFSTDHIIHNHIRLVKTRPVPNPNSPPQCQNLSDNSYFAISPVVWSSFKRQLVLRKSNNRHFTSSVIRFFLSSVILRVYRLQRSFFCPVDHFLRVMEVLVACALVSLDNLNFFPHFRLSSEEGSTQILT